MEDEYQLFAGALDELMDAPLDMMGRFMDISRDFAVNTAQYDRALESEIFTNWELEARFWQLATFLMDCRGKYADTNDMEVETNVYPFSSDASILQQYKQKNPKVLETFLVKKWLQGNLVALPDEKIEIWGSKWMHTKSEIASKKRLPNSSSNNNMVSEMDTDAPLRQKRPIASEDARYDDDFFRAIFGLLRRHQITEASKLSEKTGNLTLKMAIGGLSAFDGDCDPLNDAKAVGSTSRFALWRRMCLSVASSPAGDYEKAVYGFLGGDVNTVLQVSQDWEGQLLAYTNNLCSDQFEQALDQAHRVSSKTKSIAPSVSSGQVASMQDALEVLADSSDANIKKQALHPVRTFMGAVINDTVDVIASSSSDALSDAAHTGEPNAVSESPIILRILVHLLLALRHDTSTQLDLSKFNNIVCAYVERLADENHLTLIPLYLSFLDSEDVVDQYSFYLANISDPDARHQQIQLANQYGVDIKACVKAAVARVFSESMSTYVIPEIVAVKFENNVDNTDVRLYRAVEWFEDVKMWSETVDASVRLLRRFLLCGKTGAAREAGMRLDIPMLMQQYQADTLGCDQNDVDELIALELDQLHDLIQFLDAINSWEHLLENNSRDKTQVAFKVAEIAKLAHKIIQGGWMCELRERYTRNGDINPQEYTHLDHLRQIYIPYTILQLLAVYVRSRHIDSDYIYEAIDLSVLVADNQDQIYLNFVDSGRLEEFLQAIFHASSLAK